MLSVRSSVSLSWEALSTTGQLVSFGAQLPDSSACVPSWYQIPPCIPQSSCALLLWHNDLSLWRSCLLIHIWASSGEGPAPVLRGRLPEHTQHRFISTTGEEWMEVLWSQGPFILALGSALRCEPGPGHERTASCQPRSSCDKWWLAASSCLTLWSQGSLSK